MEGKILNDDDLLLFDAIALIQAYEEGMFKEVGKGDPSEEVILTAYQHPLTGMQSTIELSLLSAESSMGDIVNAVVLDEQRSDPREAVTTKVSSLNAKEKVDHFYSRCSFTDSKGEPTEEWWDPQDAVVKKNLDLLNEKDGNVGYEYRKKFTNEYNQSFGAKVTDYIDKNAPTVDIGGKTYKLSVEECLNCMIDIDFKLTLPSLEFVFNLDKLLKQVASTLKLMKKAMDPSQLYGSLCAFLGNFGANFSCPANLIGINLVLPTLFAKYSMDLAKVRFDWTSMFGSMIKAVLNYLVQAVESVPKIVNPFIDCIINSLRTVMSAIKSIVASGERITKETISAVNQVGYAVQKVTPNSWFDPASVDLKQEYDDLIEEMNDKLQEEESDMKGYSSKKVPEELEEFAEWLKETTIQNNTPTYTLSNTQKMLEEYLKDPDNSDLKHYLNHSYKTKSNEIKGQGDELKRSYEKKIEAAEKKEKLESEKDFFNFDFVADTKEITTPFFSKSKKPNKKLNFDFNPNSNSKIPLIGPIEARDSSIKKSDWNAIDYAFAKYGVDVSNQYRQPKDLINYRPKGWVAKIESSDPFQWVEKTIIAYLMKAKLWMNEQVGKIIQTLKALQVFIGDTVASEFKLLGEVQMIAHLVRFIKLIMKIFEEGLSCKNIKQNKETIEKIIAANNENILIKTESLPMTYRGVSLSPEEYIEIKHKVTDTTTIINLNECSELSSVLKVKKDNLDAIYEGILNGLHA
jgi:hypothetical protein